MYKIYTRINKFKHKMIVYNIEFYAYLTKILIYSFIHFDFRSDPESDPEFFSSWAGSVEKKCRILIPVFINYQNIFQEFCQFSQTLQPQSRESFYKTLSSLGVLPGLEITLQSTVKVPVDPVWIRIRAVEKQIRF